MLAITSTRHQVFFTVSGLFGCGDYKSYGNRVDDTIDRLFTKCQNDSATISKLANSNSREEACQILAKQLRSITEGYPWLWKHAGQEICRRVLFLLHPDRFGFETYGWIH